MKNNRRWGDNDKQWGPFTYAREKGRDTWEILLDSGGDENSGCHLRLQGLGHTLICELPPIIKPWRHWVNTKGMWAGAGDGFWDEHPNEYGVRLSSNHLYISLGPQTGDSSTTRKWSCFLPWNEWRHVRTTLYDLNGKAFWEQHAKDRKRDANAWRHESDARERCPKACFDFEDYDGERITATTHITESEARLGTKWFKWLSVFRRPRIHRYLYLSFSKEVGREKGSWKGGTLGHSIEMLPGELHESAFRRYCERDHRSKSGPFQIKFLGCPVPEAA